MGKFRIVASNILYLLISVMVLVCMSMNGMNFTISEWWIAVVGIIAALFVNWLVDY